MTPTLSPEQIAEIEALLEKATPGPWETRPMLWDDGSSGPDTFLTDGKSNLGQEYDPDDSAAIAALRNAAPALIAMAKLHLDRVKGGSTWFDEYQASARREVEALRRAEKAEAERDQLRTENTALVCRLAIAESDDQAVEFLSLQKVYVDNLALAKAERDRHRERAVTLAQHVQYLVNNVLLPVMAQSSREVLSSPDIVALLEEESRRG